MFAFHSHTIMNPGSSQYGSVLYNKLDKHKKHTKVIKIVLKLYIAFSSCYASVVVVVEIADCASSACAIITCA